jgi:CheY-like chemotaxis protein
MTSPAGLSLDSAERDKLLLQRMTAGESDALAALYDHLAPKIMGVLVRLLSSPSLAEDVLEETFLHAWRHAEAYRPETGTPCSWLLAIARSRGAECFRREAARKQAGWANPQSNGCSLAQGSRQQRPGGVFGRADSTTAVLPFQGHRILIVDHNSDFLLAFGLVLKDFGAKVDEATSAGTALESLITRRPDLLISDLRMPGMDGFGLVEAIRALPESLGGRTPAIALSGAPARDVVSRVHKSGFQMFLQKPLNEDELLLAVPALVGRSRRLEA